MNKLMLALTFTYQAIKNINILFILIISTQTNFFKALIFTKKETLEKLACLMNYGSSSLEIPPRSEIPFKRQK